MSMRTDMGFAKEAVKGGSLKPKPREEKTPAGIAEEASRSTGLQWAALQQPQTLTPHGLKKANGTARASDPRLVGPSEEDIASISTSSEAAVESPISQILAKSAGIDLAVLESRLGSAFSRTKSHNDLLGRFTSNIEYASINTLMGLLGVDPQRIDQIKSKVRTAALSEIDTNLSQLAFTKAMIDITGGA